jgi:hypothetical protein
LKNKWTPNLASKILESEPKENVLEQWSSPQYLSEDLDDRYNILSGPHVRVGPWPKTFGLLWGQDSEVETQNTGDTGTKLASGNAPLV